MLDVVLAGIGMAFQELVRHQHESRCAEAALERTRLYESLLHRRQSGLIEMLDGRDLRPVRAHREIETARNRDIIHQHCAAAAQTLAAGFARAGQAELVQQLDESPMRLDNGAHRAIVQREADRARAHSSSSSGWPSRALSARSTRSAVIGSSVSRTPMASSIALAIAGDTPKVAVSPTPLAPKGPDSCSASTNSVSIAGM